MHSDNTRFARMAKAAQQRRPCDAQRDTPGDPTEHVTRTDEHIAKRTSRAFHTLKSVLDNVALDFSIPRESTAARHQGKKKASVTRSAWALGGSASPTKTSRKMTKKFFPR